MRMLCLSYLIRVLSDIVLCRALETYKETIKSPASTQNSPFYLATVLGFYSSFENEVDFVSCRLRRCSGRFGAYTHFI